jgi:hypothetical protein
VIVMRRMIATAVLVVGVLAAASGCGTGSITRVGLQDDIGPTFRNLYLLQQDWLGNDDPYTTADTSVASCTKGGASTPDSGPGDDWICVVHWPSPSGITEPISYDVRVQPGGCYTADGPATTIGQQTMQTPDGRTVVNPLYAFDGCLNIG